MKKRLFFLITLVALALGACSSGPPLSKSGVNFVPTPLVTIYQASYDYTWKAALQEMQRFPLNIVNKDAGTIQTETITIISDRYESADIIKNLDPRSPTKYHLEVMVRELPAVGSIPQTEVSIIKYVVKVTQYGSLKPIKSDHIDERVIRHRIKRLLEIERTKIERNRK
jgi:hypothetical protein